MLDYLLVAVGAFAGANGRYILNNILATYSRHFPFATLLINVSGSFLLGWLLGSDPATGYRLLVGVGFFGGYTTFSTFSYEILRLIQQRQTRTALVNVLASTMFSLSAAGLGLLIAGRG